MLPGIFKRFGKAFAPGEFARCRAFEVQDRHIPDPVSATFIQEFKGRISPGLAIRFDDVDLVRIQVRQVTLFPDPFSFDRSGLTNIAHGTRNRGRLLGRSNGEDQQHTGDQE